MVAKKAASTCGSGCNTHKWITGILAVLLGAAVWNGNITLETLFGIVFVLIGLKTLFWRHCCH